VTQIDDSAAGTEMAIIGNTGLDVRARLKAVKAVLKRHQRPPPGDIKFHNSDLLENKLAQRPRRLKPLDARFRGRVKQAEDGSGCLLWTGTKDAHGYGRITIGHGRPGGGRRLAHRVAYYLAKGPIPKGMLVRHLCHTPACVNPAHLAVGTHADNARDKVEAGRVGPVGRGKLTSRDAVAIRGLRAWMGWTVEAIAAEFGITTAMTHNVLKGRSWVDAEDTELARELP
jgi:hypothetical protein